MSQNLFIPSLSLKRYGEILLSVHNLSIKNGEIITLMGPSGCGKSTLLSAICGTLDSAFSCHGEILLNGKPIQNLPPNKRNIGILFQDDLLFPHLSVSENLLYAIPANTPRKERKSIVEQALTSVELAHLDLKDPARLSGGQRSRIALARAFLAKPQTLFLDEPFSNLDAPLRKAMRTLVLHHIQSSKIPSIMVTHDKKEALAMKGRIFEIHNHILVEKNPPTS
jgi:putative thiamine transport system ATP-binding protein